jgi:hypothetical protein
MSTANTVIQVKKSGVSGNTPADLNIGELAINYADGKLFYKDVANNVSSIENQNTFETINVNSTLIVASSTTDILSLVAGNNVTLTPDAINKKITISADSFSYTGSLLTSSTSLNQILDTYDGTQYRTVRYVVQAISGSDIHSTDVVLTHNDVNTYASQYGVVKSSGNLFTLGSTIDGGVVKLLITPTNAHTQIDFVRTSLTARTLPVT